MKQKTIGNRKTNPAFYDMACRFPPPNINWIYGCPFRIGDKAVAHIQCLMWRQANPDRKLVVLEDLTQPIYSGGGVEVPADWVFDGIADEIWSAESAADPMQCPEGENLYNECLWNYWAKLRDNPPKVKTSIEPQPFSMIGLDEIFFKLRVPENYITLNPLYDAPYNSFRNATPGWWKSLAGHLAKKVPIVMVGTKPILRRLKIWETTFTLFGNITSMSWTVSLSFIQVNVMLVANAARPYGHQY